MTQLGRTLDLKFGQIIPRRPQDQPQVVDRALVTMHHSQTGEPINPKGLDPRKP